MRRTVLTLSLAAAVSMAMPDPGMADDVMSQDRRAFADGLMSRGLYRLAMPEYEAIAKAAPQPEDLDLVLYRLAECKRKTGANTEAAAICERIKKDFPQSQIRAKAAITHALSLEAIGDKKRSADIFDTIATDAGADMVLRLNAMYFAGVNKFDAGEYAAAKARFGALVSMSAQVKGNEGLDQFVGAARICLAEIEAKGGTVDSAKSALSMFDGVASAPITPRIGAEALFKGGIAAYRAGLYDEAIARFAKLASAYPDDPRVADSLHPAMWSNFNAGRFSEALALSSKILGTGKADASLKAETLYVKASSLASLGRQAESVVAFDELIAASPSSSFAKSARYERLVALFKDGKHERLLADAALFTDPPESVAADLIWLQAESAEALGDGGKASQFYEMLFSRHPKSPLAPDAAYRRATHLRQAKSWLEAAKCYQRVAIAYHDSPLAPNALYSSACCLANLGKDEEALRDFDTLLKDYPADSLVPDAMLQKASSQQKLGDNKGAGATLDALFAKYPSFDRIGEAKFERARIFYEEKDYVKAERLLGEFLSTKPSPEAEREASFLLGLTLDAQGRKAEAAVKLQPLLAEPMRGKIPADRLAWLADFQYSQGKYREAADAAMELTHRQVSPEVLQSANVVLARSELALCNTNSAISAFKAAADSSVRSRYSAEAALRAGELMLADAAQLAVASRYLTSAASQANSPDAESIRALAYRALGECSEKQGKKDDAIRYYLAVSYLFSDGDVVPSAMNAAARLLDEAGRTEEAESVRAELAGIKNEEAGK